METTTEKRILRALVFMSIVIILLAVFSCSKPAERVIRTQRPAIFQLKPGYTWLIDYITFNYDSTTNSVTSFSNQDDNRWPRPNGWIYSEQIQWGNLFFTDLTQKSMADYPRIYGCPMPVDTIIAHMYCYADSVCPAFYQAYAIYGGNYTVEAFDFYIESGQLSNYAEKMK